MSKINYIIGDATYPIGTVFELTRLVLEYFIIGDISITMKNLLNTTTYYYRAFAENLTGITYGNVFSFTTSGQTNKLQTTTLTPQLLPISNSYSVVSQYVRYYQLQFLPSLLHKTYNHTKLRALDLLLY